jgi:methylated-DNA-[protein]-cysteine S-methyltransferase
MIRFSEISSPVGRLRLVDDGKGLVSIDFLASRNVKSPGGDWVKDARFFRPLEKALKERFFKGKPLPVFPLGDFGGTRFQRSVWRAMEKIPRGETRTYAQIAAAAGRPGAARAVGTACGANPLPLIVPCHRVVASGGGLGGFSAGLAVKKKLLRLEGALPGL